MLFYRWCNVCDAGPALKQYWINVSMFTGVCFLDKQWCKYTRIWQTRYIDQMLVKCWTLGEPTFKQHWVNASLLLESGKWCELYSGVAITTRSNKETCGRWANIVYKYLEMGGIPTGNSSHHFRFIWHWNTLRENVQKRNMEDFCTPRKAGWNTTCRWAPSSFKRKQCFVRI